MEDGTDDSNILIEKKAKIENMLNNIKKDRDEMENKQKTITEEIKRDHETYTKKKEKLENLKILVDEKKEKYKSLCCKIETYRRHKRKVLEREYEKEIKGIINAVNGIEFTFKLGIFEDFDRIKGIPAHRFPALQKRIEKCITRRQNELKMKLCENLYHEMDDLENLPDQIFCLNFMVRYEKYFSDRIFANFIETLIKEEFEYHFYGNKETNRLDKPEWMFEFLESKIDEYRELYMHYKECAVKAKTEHISYQKIIEDVMFLVERKIAELSRNEGPQKIRLVLNFAFEFKKFQGSIYKKYGTALISTELHDLIARSNDEFVRSEMQRISGLPYVQWFSEYRELVGTTMRYIVGLGDVRTGFLLETLGEYIATHIRAFVDNLMFIDREEIKVACFVFSETEELKNFIYLEMNEYLLGYPEMRDFSGPTIDLLNELMAHIFKILKHLSGNETFKALERVDSYPHVSSESRRLFIVDVHRIFDEYRGCSYSVAIEKHVKNIVDNFISSSIILKTRLTFEEYLEFRSFYKKIKRCFSDGGWESDLLSDALEKIFNGEKVRNKQLMALYFS